jgi:hypothetical protein
LFRFQLDGHWRGQLWLDRHKLLQR